MKFSKNWRWVGYRICDNSGCGFKVWKYVIVPLWCKSPNNIRLYIFEEYENWAYECGYSFKLNMRPKVPLKIIEEKHDEMDEQRIALEELCQDLAHFYVLRKIT